MLNGSKWDSMSDADKTNLINNILEPAFIQGKTNTLAAGQTVQNTFWSQLSPAYTSAGWDSFIKANAWIQARIDTLVARYGIPFTYMNNSSTTTTMTITPGTPATITTPTTPGTTNWTLITIAALVSLGAVYFTYKYTRKS